jgi:hypothetical protein
VHPADIQDRDGGIMLLSTLFGMFPFLQKLFADSAYQGPLFNSDLAKMLPCLKTEIVKRSDHAKGFVVLPKRWIVERTMPGSIAAGALPKILRISTAIHWLSFDWPPSGLCCESSVILDKLLGQTLTNNFQ